MRIITTETVNATYIRQLARDIFKFSYLCAGIPFVDIANLTMENINRQSLSYVRQKTHGEVKGIIGKEAKEIIDKYAYHRKKATYLFPIFDARIGTGIGEQRQSDNLPKSSHLRYLNGFCWSSYGKHIKDDGTYKYQNYTRVYKSYR